MTAPFDWAGLAYHTSYIYRHEDQYAAAAYIRERIEAAFVPAWQHKATCIGYSLDVEEATVRAKAAEARVKALEEALQWVLDHDPKRPGLRFESYEGLLESLMGRLRQTLGDNHE